MITTVRANAVPFQRRKEENEQEEGEKDVDMELLTADRRNELMRRQDWEPRGS